MIYLPYDDFRACAKVLHDKEIEVARVTALVVVEQLVWELELGRLAEAWQGCADALGWYGMELGIEWEKRGHKDNVGWQIEDRLGIMPEHPDMPDFLGSIDFHACERDKLIAARPDHYRKYFS